MTFSNQLVRSVRAAGRMSFARGALLRRSGIVAAPRFFSEQAATFSPTRAAKETEKAPAKSKSSSASKAESSTKKAATKKATGAKAAKKPAKKVAKKSKVKTSAKSKAKPKKKKAQKLEDMTPEKRARVETKQRREKFRELIAASLYRTEPTKGFVSPWSFFIKKQTLGSKTPSIVELSKEFKELSESDKAAIAQEADMFNAERKKAHGEWVLRHTPLQIYKANLARMSIRRLVNQNRTGFSIMKINPLPIQDDRQVKRPGSPTSLFIRSKAGQENISVKERFQGWAELNESEKQKFRDQFTKVRNEYHKACEQVYGPGVVPARRRN